MNKNNYHGNYKFTSERGFALLSTLIIVAIVLGVVGLMATRALHAPRVNRNLENRALENSIAVARASATEAAIKYDFVEKYKSDVAAARALAGMRPLPVFDDQSLASSDSRPVWNGSGQANSPDAATSLLGNLNSYATSQIDSLEAKGVDLGSERFGRIFEFRETFRRKLVGRAAQSQSEFYQLAYKVEGRAGIGGRAELAGTVNLGGFDAGCSTTIAGAVSPQTIRRGSSAAIDVAYSSANSVQLIAAGSNYRTDTVAYDDNISHENLTVQPTSTTVYQAVARGGQCVATSAPFTLNVVWNDAAFVGWSVPSQVDAGSTTAVSVTMKNTGTTTWRPNAYFLTSIQGSWNISQVSVSRDIAPGDSETFAFNIIAPTNCPVTLPFQWQMQEQNVEFFGQTTPLQNIQVNCRTCPTIAPGVAGLNSDKTNVLPAGDVVTFSWSVSNADASTVVTFSDGVNAVTVGPSGSRSLFVSTPTIFTLVVSHPGCSNDQRQISINVGFATPSPTPPLNPTPTPTPTPQTCPVTPPVTGTSQSYDISDSVNAPRADGYYFRVNEIHLTYSRNSNSYSGTIEWRSQDFIYPNRCQSQSIYTDLSSFELRDVQGRLIPIPASSISSQGFKLILTNVPALTPRPSQLGTITLTSHTTIDKTEIDTCFASHSESDATDSPCFGVTNNPSSPT